jgi:hypothetical protein
MLAIIFRVGASNTDLTCQLGSIVQTLPVYMKLDRFSGLLGFVWLPFLFFRAGKMISAE